MKTSVAFYRTSKVIASVALLTITIAQMLYLQLVVPSGHPRNLNDNLKENLAESLAENLADRPVMNTFYDASKLEDAYVLETWREEWNNAGFNTIVLSLEDAKMHPKFDEMEIIIDAHATGEDASSFYRWLAVAASGAGWMSTYETFPIRFPMSDAIDLPNDGVLTSFQGHVPSLVSGTKEEYDRVIELMLDAIIRTPGETKSDEDALKILRDEGTHDINFRYPPENVQRGFAYISPRAVDCDKMLQVRAVRISPELSQDAIVNGLNPFMPSDPLNPSHRAVSYKMFLQDWKNQCGEDGRPVMHTFFHSVDSMSTEDSVLKLWKEEWENAGFHTVVLTLQDAKKHPNFEEVEKIMEPLHGAAGYNALCFYRWLAMAASGGGWMSDHDALPTNFPMNEGFNLPNDGNFIIFAGHVPALMSGTVEEWNRLSKLIIDTIPRIKSLAGGEEAVVSDMHSLEVLRRERNDSIVFYQNGVQDGYLYDSPGQISCDKMSVGRAVHMSHADTHKAITEGVYPLEVMDDDPYGSKSRAEGARIFMIDWRSQCKDISIKPVMHTFFHGSSPIEEAVLQLWKDEWTRAGFEPVVLTLDDAKRHPDFETVENTVIPLHGKTGYDSLCFYRWLAMAASGGGWMSDHDTYPLNFPLEIGFELPNEGTFTSFQNHIPALMSGSEDEWNRVSKLVIDAIPRIAEGSTLSDMYAFDVLKRENNADIIFKNGLVQGEVVEKGFLYLSPREVNCATAMEALAVHMSHSSVHQAVLDGFYPLEVRTDDPTGSHHRAEAAKVFLDDFRTQCS